MWSNEHVERLVMEAYNRGRRDAMVAIGQTLRELLTPEDDLERVLYETHGLLAPEPDE